MRLNLNSCPCGSGVDYKKCCRLFHKNKKRAKSPLELMKSRYSAYAKGEVKYIVKTTHLSNIQYQNPNWINEIKLFCKSEFKQLEIIYFDNKYVEFKAYIDDYVIFERSEFIFDNGWKYLRDVFNKNLKKGE
jgi:SEC-C motif-containing protein